MATARGFRSTHLANRRIRRTVDETNAAIGLARFHTQGDDARSRCSRESRTICSIWAPICACPKKGAASVGPLRVAHDAQVERLEREIDAMNVELSPLTSFVLPGGTPAAAYLHLARTISRGAQSD